MSLIIFMPGKFFYGYAAAKPGDGHLFETSG
jgi:hypothetical protein